MRPAPCFFASFRRDVAIVTASPCKRRMDDSLEKFRIFGSMGIMATLAIHDTWIDAEMGFAKSWPFKIVAFPAQGLDGLVHQGSLG